MEIEIPDVRVSKERVQGLETAVNTAMEARRIGLLSAECQSAVLPLDYASICEKDSPPI